MKKQFECNATEVFEKFSSLAKIEMTKAMKSAIRTGAMTLKKETISRAKGGIQSYNNHPDEKYNRYSILDAVMVTKMQDRAGEDLMMKVHVLGNRKQNSKTFRFRFLEGGTRNRFQGKRSIGQIKPRGYFREAKAAVLPQMDQIFISKINECVNKVNNTKF